MTKFLMIPATVTVEVDDDFDSADEDALYEQVVDQHGKYVELDARNLGYDQVEEA